MSVIAVKVYDDKIEIAADSQATVADDTYKVVLGRKDSKLFVSDNIILGAAGEYENISMLKTFLKINPQDIHSVEDVYEFLKIFRKWEREIKGTEVNNDQSFILVTNGKAFYINCFEVQEVEAHMSIGTGGRISTTVMNYNPKESAENAVKQAIKEDIYCGGPIICYTMDKLSGTIFKDNKPYQER